MPAIDIALTADLKVNATDTIMHHHSQHNCRLNPLDITIINIDLRLQDQLQMQRTSPTGFNDQVNPNHSSVSYARPSSSNLVSDDDHQPLHVKPFLGITFSFQAIPFNHSNQVIRDFTTLPITTILIPIITSPQHHLSPYTCLIVSHHYIQLHILSKHLQ
jgi:hypothetical protein